MALPKPNTRGTIKAGGYRGQHGTVVEPQGYWVLTDGNVLAGPFYRESSFQADVAAGITVTGTTLNWPGYGTNCAIIEDGVTRYEVHSSPWTPAAAPGKTVEYDVEDPALGWLGRVKITWPATPGQHRRDVRRRRRWESYRRQTPTCSTRAPRRVRVLV